VACIYIGLSTKNWPTVTGRVLSSEILIRDNFLEPSKGKFFYPAISYEFRVGTKNYRSKRLGNFLVFSGDKQFAENMVTRFGQNHQVKIYYHPLFPYLSALVPEIQKPYLLLLFLFTGIAVSIAMGQALFSDNPLWFKNVT
jgi:hypothetical protein